MTDPNDSTELDTAIAGVYHGPLEEFIARRDALARQLRAAKRREDADRVKALRKPSRTAWALDNIVHEDPEAIEQLVTAISEAQSGSDVRTAVETVRGAIRNVAAAGARAAIRAGHPIEATVLTTALHALIGDSGAFAELRAGRLVEVPEGGGLDILYATALAAPAKPLGTTVRAGSESPKVEAPEVEPALVEPPKPDPRTERARAAEEKKRRERELAAKADLERAEAALREARDHSTHADRLARDAQKNVDAAEEAVLRAQTELDARRGELEQARRTAEAAAAQLRESEHEVAAARARVLDRTDDYQTE